MTRNSMAKVLLSLTWAYSSCGIASAASDCPIVYNEYTDTSEANLYQLAKKAICLNEVKDESSAQSSAQSSGLGLGVFEDILKLNLNGNGSSAQQGWSKWQKAFCASSFDELKTTFHQSVANKVLSEPAAGVLQACVEKELVYPYFKVNASRDGFVFRLNVAGKDSLKSASVSPASAVKGCDPDNPFGISIVDKFTGGRDISGTPQEFGCAWSPTQPVTVSVVLARNGQKALQLAAIPLTSPPPVKEYWCTSTVRLPLLVRAFVEGKGEDSGANDSWVGTRGDAAKVYKYSVQFAPGVFPIVRDLGIRYRCHIGGHGWGDWKTDGAWCADFDGGRTEAIAIELTGKEAADFTLNYYCHAEGLGNVGPAPLADGNVGCGSVGAAKRIEAIYVSIQSDAPQKHGGLCK